MAEQGDDSLLVSESHGLSKTDPSQGDLVVIHRDGAGRGPSDVEQGDTVLLLNRELAQGAAPAGIGPKTSWFQYGRDETMDGHETLHAGYSGSPVEAWTYTGGGFPFGAVATDKYLIGGSRGGISALNKETAEEVWSHSFNGRGYTTGNGLAAVVNVDDASLQAYTFEGSLAWTFSFVQTNQADSGVVYDESNNQFIFPSDNGDVHAVDADSGNANWSVAVSSSDRGYPCISGDMAVVGGSNDEYIALDTANGSVVWRSTVDAAARGAPCAGGGNIYAIADESSSPYTYYQYSINAADGSRNWRDSYGSQAGRMTISPSYDGTNVYFPFGGGAGEPLRAYDPDSGVVQWTFSDTDSDGLWGGASIDANGDIHFADQSGVIYKIDKSGNIIQKITGYFAEWECHPVIADGSVYYTSPGTGPDVLRMDTA